MYEDPDDAIRAVERLAERRLSARGHGPPLVGRRRSMAERRNRVVLVGAAVIPGGKPEAEHRRPDRVTDCHEPLGPIPEPSSAVPDDLACCLNSLSASLRKPFQLQPLAIDRCVAVHHMKIVPRHDPCSKLEAGAPWLSAADA